jgi:hypothetical protein
MQNQVRFLTSRKMWMKSKTNMIVAAMTPPAMDGVYGHSTYFGTAEESSARPMIDMVSRGDVRRVMRVSSLWCYLIQV